MDILKDAKIVVSILKENGFEAYIVGGAVRDYLLRTEINDVDITTNATPNEVQRLFKSKPTGLKYGTVTVFFKTNEFEVTTYRKESGYTNHRHPEEVEFGVTAEEDVQRRDFTMNGLLMDETGLIIDYVDGKKDIKYKFIKAIGNPDERFKEDALRMLRAFYFQSKLGFEIDEATKLAIEKNRELIKEVASERVLDEMLKLLHGEHMKKAFETMVETKFHEVLPGLEKGIDFFSKSKHVPKIDMFFITCFVLNGRIPKYWKFSNRNKRKYELVLKLAKNTNDYGAKELYNYGLENCQAANRVNYFLGKTTLQALDLVKKFNELPITSELDLKFRANDILKHTNRKAGAWVNNILQDMVNKILDKELTNDYEVLKTYVLENFERF